MYSIKYCKQMRGKRFPAIDVTKVGQKRGSFFP